MIGARYFLLLHLYLTKITVENQRNGILATPECRNFFIRGVIDLLLPEEHLALPVAEYFPLKRSTKPKLVDDG